LPRSSSKPLFATDPTFVYATDDLISDEIKTDTTKAMATLWTSRTQRFKRSPSGMNGNYTPEAESETKILALFTNATGAIGGGNNVCDGLLGSECIDNLLDLLKIRMVADRKTSTY
jgi:hypothetical protein